MSRARFAPAAIRPLRVLLPSFALIASLLVSGSAIAQGAGAAPRENYWGVLPPGSDSTAVPTADRPKARWEKAVLAPYRVVTFPVALLSRGVGSSIAYLDEHRVPERVARLLGPRRGPFGLLIELESGAVSGVGGGITAEHTSFLGSGNTLRVGGSTTSHRDHRLKLAARFGRSRAGSFELGAAYKRQPSVRFFGIGPGAEAADESFMREEAAWLGASLRRPLGRASSVQADVEYTTVATGAPRPGQDPAVELRFAGALPPGFGRHSYGPAAGGQWMHESPGLANRPGRGGLQRLRVSYFDAFDREDVKFWTFRGEAQQFLTLLRPGRVLALRGVASWIESTGSDPVPLTRLNTNDDPDLLRGFDDFRFRDRGLAIATAEYRWRVWVHENVGGPGLDAYLLTDAGQVFGDSREIGLRALTLSYGGGLRVESGHGLALRMEYARSDEGGVLRVRADQVFQFTKGGYFHGRDPFPAR